jgi:SAM-dependent methyltransferase
MPIDVRFLRDFYGTPLGHRAAGDFLRVLSAMAPPPGGKMLCVGYGLPLFSFVNDQKTQIFWSMPARQGIMPWPSEHPARAVLLEESRLPFAHETFDTIVLIHSLEFTRDPEDFLNEILRVATRAASILLIVPNRLGLWAHMDQTPFGYGHPYSLFQLTDALRACSLKIVAKKAALSFFPSKYAWARHPLWSRFWPQPLAGAWCVRVERGAVAAPKPAFVYSGLSVRGSVPQPSGCGRSAPSLIQEKP